LTIKSSRNQLLEVGKEDEERAFAMVDEEVILIFSIKEAN
jgi:hypothetical protein